MLKRFEIWGYGLKMLFFILLMALLPPIAIATFFTVGIELALYILPLKSFTLSDHYNDIFFLSLLIFGPYFVGQQWNVLEDLAKNIHPSRTDKT